MNTGQNIYKHIINYLRKLSLKYRLKPLLAGRGLAAFIIFFFFFIAIRDEVFSDKQ